MLLSFIRTEFQDGQDFIEFIDITTDYTGRLTGTDDGCTSVIYANRGLPFGTTTHNHVYVSTLFPQG